jgi:hypothetical protein
MVAGEAEFVLPDCLVIRDLLEDIAGGNADRVATAYAARPVARRAEGFGVGPDTGRRVRRNAFEIYYVPAATYQLGKVGTRSSIGYGNGPGGIKAVKHPICNFPIAELEERTAESVTGA